MMMMIVFIAFEKKKRRKTLRRRYVFNLSLFVWEEEKKSGEETFFGHWNKKTLPILHCQKIFFCLALLFFFRYASHASFGEVPRLRR